MIISDFYQTKIESFDYSEYGKGNGFIPCHTLDGTAETTRELLVKVSLIDFNSEPVRNRTVKLSVNMGSFGDKDIVSNKTFEKTSGNNKQITGTTGNDGAIYVHYEIHSSERGICNFSANEANIQVDNLNPYPVGSIYMNINPVNPANLFGGEWERIEGRFLLGAHGVSQTGTTYKSGDTGGSATVTLTKEQMPVHNHTQSSHSHQQQGHYSDGEGKDWAYKLTDKRKQVKHTTTSQAPAIQNAGGGKPHNNMPPYLAVFIWKRVA